MRFERLIEDGRLWAVMYDGEKENVFAKVFDLWNDYEWLEDFFCKHIEDLSRYFHITEWEEEKARQEEEDLPMPLG